MTLIQHHDQAPAAGPVEQGDDGWSSGAGPVAPRVATTLRPLPFMATSLTGGFLGDLQRENATTSIPRGQEHLEHEGAWANFTHAAARRVGERYHGPVFEDGEAFKWLEAVAWQAAWSSDPRLTQWLAHYSDLAEQAQADDGYLATFNQAAGKRDRYEWMSYDHEIFNMATLVQAGVAAHRATRTTALLDVAVRAADHLDATFGWGKREQTCGHPLAEMALVELYRTTGEDKFLQLAQFFVDVRGRGTLSDPTDQHWDSSYFSDRIPVRQSTHPEGHAVRAVYFASGATDVALESGDEQLLDTLIQQWDAMVGSKTYINGSLGSRWEGEAFGDPYELPTDRGYGETCAAIASLQWSWRLLLATGQAKYADLIERQLYNAVLSGVSLDGQKYFYVNTLQVREGALVTDSRMPAGGRREWFGCSCCPTNLMRTLATIHTMLATSSPAGVQVHQYATADIQAPETRLHVEADYPWDGRIRVQVNQSPVQPWELSLRVPAWADGATLTVNGQPDAREDRHVGGEADGQRDGTASGEADAGPTPVTAGQYARLTRRWQVGDEVVLQLPMDPRAESGHPRVDAVRGAVCWWRGPLLYALEQVDQPDGVLVDDVHLSELRAKEQRSDHFNGVPVLKLPVRQGPYGPAGEATAIPYFMWANREVGPMRVWVPLVPAPPPGGTAPAAGTAGEVDQ